MSGFQCAALNRLLERYAHEPHLSGLKSRLHDIDGPAALIRLYDKAIPLIEAVLSDRRFPDDELDTYQQLFHELEALIQANGQDERHTFTIIIPVADRPQHLASCLGSIWQLCRAYQYGGFDGKRFAKVEVLIADDSKEPDNIARHRELAGEYSRQGLRTDYFGLDQQQAQLAKLDAAERARLTAILGDIAPDAFYHKGASLMRNIAYLRLNEMARQGRRRLFHFIDSDQEFKVKVRGVEGDRNILALNFFYHLDRIFRTTDSMILTGKVVGDPPVSPAVMAGNFLEDVIAFLTRMARLPAGQTCQFHGKQQQADDAAYHDMADLFGFKPAADSFHYHCTLRGEHDHTRCLADFASKLNRFFDGEHPTRKSYFEYEDVDASVKPARTIYTGNYVFKPEALRYFVPFAPLKLRMAGPVLGRIIKAEVGNRFVSANLPMLHKRTVKAINQSEFRPGIQREAERVDLAGEFERQYFGDVMLFSMEELTNRGYPTARLTEQQVSETIHSVEARMQGLYTQKHEQIQRKITLLHELFENPEPWWNRAGSLEQARADFHQFIGNIEHNFGKQAEGYAIIHRQEHRQQRLAQITRAILGYASERSAWEETLKAQGGGRA